MKWTLPLVLPALVGCQAFQAATTVQPKGVRYFQEESAVMRLEGFQELILRAPVETVVDQDGTTTTRPLKDAEGNYILPKFFVKDVSIQPPKTWLDFGNTLIRAGLAWALGDAAFGVIEEGIKQIRDPRIITTDKLVSENTVITQNSSGSFKVDHFTN